MFQMKDRSWCDILNDIYMGGGSIRISKVEIMWKVEIRG